MKVKSSRFKVELKAALDNLNYYGEGGYPLDNMGAIRYLQIKDLKLKGGKVKR